MGEALFWQAAIGLGFGTVSFFARARFATIPHRLSEAGLVAGIFVLLAAFLPLEMRPSIPSLAFFVAGCLCFGCALHLYGQRPLALPPASLPPASEPAVPVVAAPAPVQQAVPISDLGGAIVNEGPIAWAPDSLAMVVQAESFPPEAEPKVTLIKMYGARNVSREPLTGVRAFVRPELTGNDLPMVFYDPHADVTKKTSILPGEEFYLYYDFRPLTDDKRGIAFRQYLDTYGGITIRVEAGGQVVFKRSFAYSEIKQMLGARLAQYLDAQKLKH